MKLALGTVQFGLDYGVTNHDGKMTSNEASQIIKAANINGIQLFDTADVYGDSEQVLGTLTKNIKPAKFISKFSSDSSILINIKQSLQNSLLNLQCNSLYGLLFHKETDLLGKQGELCYQQLLALKEQGLIKKIGASFYSLTALEKALQHFKLDIIQIPASCLDQRFQQSGLLKEAQRQNIEVHARSLFLQGLLLNSSIELPSSILKFTTQIQAFINFAERHKLTPLQLALTYLIQCNEIDIGVVGCQNKQQLIDIITAYQYVNQRKTPINLTELAVSHEQLINPSLW